MILDACAVLAYMKREPAADEVEPFLHLAPAERTLTSAGVAEVIDHLIRVHGADEEEVALDLAQLGLLEGIDGSIQVGKDAGRLRARRYHHRDCRVSVVDCIAAEAARHSQRPLVTSDAHLLDVCAAEGIATVALTRSDGSRWNPSPHVP